MTPLRSFLGNWPLTALLALLLALIPPVASAVDLLPFGSVDGQQQGKVSTAELVERGAVYSTATWQSHDSVLKQSELNLSSQDPLTSNKASLERGHRASAYFGFGLSRKVELSLGVHGTYESVKPETRDSIFPIAAESSTNGADDQGWRGSLKQTGFSGASVFAKFQLLKNKDFKLALAPFIETGAGESATYALTRSINPKAGWLALLTYGARGVGEINLNAGYRYRNPEAVGTLTLRNEALLQASLKAYLSEDFALLLSAQGRRLMVAGARDQLDGESLSYQPRDAGEVSAGAIAHLGKADLSFFIGSHLKNKAGLGFGRAIGGFSLAYELGNFRGPRPKHRLSEDVDERTKANTDGEAIVLENPDADKAKLKKPKQEVIEVSADYEDDFDLVQKKLEAESKKYGNKKSPTDEVEEELAKLRAADEKAEAERLERERRESEQRREQMLQQKIEEEQQMQEWLKEAQEETNQIEGISDEQMNWQGLE